MVESLRLEFDLTPKDMEKVQEEVLERKIGRVGKWFWLTFVGVGVALGAISMYLRGDPADRPFMVAFVLTVAGVVLAFQWWKRRRARPAIVVEIDADEVRITMSGTCQIMPWSVLGTLAETSNYFVLPQRKGTFSYILPKRAFPDEDSQEWLRAVAESAATGERAEPQPETARPSMDYRSLAVEFRLAYRDYLDRSIASWATRRICGLRHVESVRLLHHRRSQSAQRCDLPVVAGVAHARSVLDALGSDTGHLGCDRSVDEQPAKPCRPDRHALAGWAGFDLQRRTRCDELGNSGVLQRDAVEFHHLVPKHGRLASASQASVFDGRRGEPVPGSPRGVCNAIDVVLWPLRRWQAPFCMPINLRCAPYFGVSRQKSYTCCRRTPR